MSCPIAVRIRKRWPAPLIPTSFSVACPCLVLGDLVTLLGIEEH